MAWRRRQRLRDFAPRRWLGVVAVACFVVGAERTAWAGPQPCTDANGVATCQGNQSSGIASGATVPPGDFLDTDTVLYVNGLTANIAPATTVDGIAFSSTTEAVNIDSNTGPFAIITTGDNAQGIFAGSDNGPVMITSIGNIATSGTGADGILAENDAAEMITVHSTGNITTTGQTANGITASSSAGGTINIISTGNISTHGEGAQGIFVSSGDPMHPAARLR